jgi:hypothetical protein
VAATLLSHVAASWGIPLPALKRGRIHKRQCMRHPRATIPAYLHDVFPFSSVWHRWLK